MTQSAKADSDLFLDPSGRDEKLPARRRRARSSEALRNHELAQDEEPIVDESMAVVDGEPAIDGQTREVTRHRTREGILQMILNGEYQPGERLVQSTLAKKLNVSRGVIREAALELQACGVVETIDNSGMVVFQANEQHLLECYEVREMLEALSVRLCCDRITVREVRELRELADEIHEMHKLGRMLDHARLDRKFHLELIRISGNQLLQRLTQWHWLLGKFTTFKQANAARSLKEHLEIIDCIAAGNADGAESIVRQHIRNGKKMFEQHLAEKNK